MIGSYLELAVHCLGQLAKYTTLRSRRTAHNRLRITANTDRVMATDHRRVNQVISMYFIDIKGANNS